jgi:hypothetical protein
MAWNELDVQRLPRYSRRERLLGHIVLPVLALAAFSRYVPQLMDWMSSSPEDENYLAAQASRGQSQCSTWASSCPPRS